MNDLTLPDGHDLPGLDDRLRDLADRLQAPASDRTRKAIGRRSRVLRRRRHARRAAAGGALAALVVVGAVALRHERADVELGPAESPSGLPALTLDLPGWTVTRAEEHHDVADLAGLAGAGDGEQRGGESSVQVFRPDDRLDGPVVYLEQSLASDAVIANPGDDEVDVNGAQGYLAELDGGNVSLRWNPASGGGQARLSAVGLDTGQVLAFARDLDQLEDRQLGFALSENLRGIQEIILPAGGDEPVDVRQSWLTHDGDAGQELVEIQVDNRGERAFETGLYDLSQVAPWDLAEQVSVLGRPALLRHDLASGEWVVQWRHDERAWVTVTISSDAGRGGTDRTTVDDIVAHLRELSEDGWQALLADTPPR